MPPFNDTHSLMAGLSNGRGATVPHEGPVLPNDEDIATLAYRKFLARGSQHGLDREDWLDARRDLLGEAMVTSRSHDDTSDV